MSNQFHDRGIQIVVVHEARSAGPTIRPSGQFVAICSGSTGQRQNGEEIWLSTQQPVVIDGMDHWMSADNIHVIHAEPTVLLVELSLGCHRVPLLAAHSPPF